MKKSKIIVGLIIVCLFVLFIAFYNLKQLQEISKTGVPDKEYIDPKDDENLNLSGFGIFFDKYKGDLKSSEIAKKLEEVTVNALPKTYNTVKSYNETELQEYYSKNKNSIQSDFGIRNFEEFSDFILAIKQTKIDIQTWYRLDILKDTYIDQSDMEGYAYVEYEVSHHDEQKIRYSLYISKSKTQRPTYIINVVE